MFPIRTVLRVRACIYIQSRWRGYIHRCRKSNFGYDLETTSYTSYVRMLRAVVRLQRHLRWTQVKMRVRLLNELAIHVASINSCVLQLDQNIYLSLSAIT